MKILIDYIGHPDLFESLRILFEDKLGYEVHQPVGKDWKEKGFVKYLFSKKELSKRFEREYKGISLDDFLKTDFDLVIATAYHSEEAFERLAKDHKNKPRFIRQLGNPLETPNCKNVLAAVPAEHFLKGNYNVVFYHPLFDFNIFKPEKPEPRICSFINQYKFYKEYKLWKKFKEKIPEYNWELYGAGCDKEISNINELAEIHRKSAFIWYVKYTYAGFNLFQAIACGKPVITRGKFYKRYGKEAKRFLKDKETCIDLDLRSPADNIQVIRECSQPKKYQEMRRKTFEFFQSIYKVDEEVNKIKKFLNNLK